MARGKSKLSGDKKKRILALILVVLGLFIAISLATSHQTDISRITGEIDSHLSPFEVKYHNQAGLIGAYLAFILNVLMGWLAYFIPFGLILLAVRLFQNNDSVTLRFSGTWLFIIALSATMVYNIGPLAAPSINVDSGFRNRRRLYC
jgi:hypothetical protein